MPTPATPEFPKITIVAGAEVPPESHELVAEWNDTTYANPAMAALVLDHMRTEEPENWTEPSNELPEGTPYVGYRALIAHLLSVTTDGADLEFADFERIGGRDYFKTPRHADILADLRKAQGRRNEKEQTKKMRLLTLDLLSSSVSLIQQQTAEYTQQNPPSVA